MYTEGWAEILYDLKPSAARIGNGDDDGAQSSGLCGLQCSGQRLQRRAGGHDVINDRNCFSFNRFRMIQAERIAKILGALSARMKMSLSGRIANAHDRSHNR